MPKFRAIIQADWLDLDEDGQLELTMVEKLSDSSWQILSYHPLLSDELGKDSLIIADISVDTLGFRLDSPKIIYHNFDNQNGLDIINYSTNSVNVYLDEISGFRHITFDAGEVSIESMTVMDIDQNGTQDFIITGNNEEGRKVFLAEPRLSPLLYQTIDIDPDYVTVFQPNEVSAAKILTFANDSLYFHGFNSFGSLLQDSVKSFNGKVTSLVQGALNQNETFDFVLTIENSLGVGSTHIYYDLNDLQELDQSNYTNTFIADFDSDGFSDIYAENDTARFYFNQDDGSFSNDSLPFSSGIVTQGDFDRDGDLDFSVVDTVDHSLNIWRNDSGTNKAPSGPGLLVLFQGQRSSAFYWSEAFDDHDGIITYDLDLLNVDNNVNYLSASFQGENNFRAQTVHGNQNTRRFAEYFNIPPGQYIFTVQPVDNSLFAGGSPASGSFELCPSVPETLVSLCKGETVTLTNNDKLSHWFSNNNGYLGEFDSLTITPLLNDIIYTVTVDAAVCGVDYQAFIIEVADPDTILPLPDLFGCEGEIVTLNISNQGFEFDSLIWNIDGDLSSSSTQLSHLLIDNVQANFEFYLGNCVVQDSIAIRISKPAFTITPRFPNILVGQSVRLATSPDYSYEWQPPQGLDDPFSDTPLASPESTTQYLVQATDSLGCTAIDSVLVTVRQSGFIPELFTPNNDGNNDRLQVHQLAIAPGFSFKIMDKRGNILYQTNVISELIRGWDGSSNGKEIPSGSYVWEVIGKNEEGLPLLINGKQKGIVNLVR